MHVCKYDITNEALLHYSLHNKESWPPTKERLMISILDGQMIVRLYIMLSMDCCQSFYNFLTFQYSASVILFAATGLSAELCYKWRTEFLF